MIVSCEKCTKKFNIRDDLIPKDGRLLQCGSCNHKWFYKLPSQNINLENEKTESLSNEETFAEEKKKIIEKIIKSSTPTKKKEVKIEEKKVINKTARKSKQGPSLFKRLILFIISVIALIILIDTFKFQIVKCIPDLDLILNNLYETLKDLTLFIKDLIN